MPEFLTNREPVWFWLDVVSPHMAHLAEELSAAGRSVTYVVERPMSADREAQGWKAPELDGVDLRIAPDVDSVVRLVESVPTRAINICLGLRGNKLVGAARTALAKRRLKQWVIMEAVEENGRLWSLLKRVEYGRLVRKWRNRVEGVLAIGNQTPTWLAARGMPADRMFPFAYFLQDHASQGTPSVRDRSAFRVLFVGQFIERKRLGVLIEALSHLKHLAFELMVVGSGPLEANLRTQARSALGDRVIWLGRQPMAEIPGHMAMADCLVLPSRHDGWGAVASEALMVGTPVIASDRCGVAGAVRASNRGGVFPAGDVEALRHVLERQVRRGPVTVSDRKMLADWAQGLGATSGAQYLDAIIRYRSGHGGRPEAPFLRELI